MRPHGDQTSRYDCSYITIKQVTAGIRRDFPELRKLVLEVMIELMYGNEGDQGNFEIINDKVPEWLIWGMITVDQLQVDITGW